MDKFKKETVRAGLSADEIHNGPSMNESQADAIESLAEEVIEGISSESTPNKTTKIEITDVPTESGPVPEETAEPTPEPIAEPIPEPTHVETPILEPETEETAVFVTKPRRSSNALLLIFLIILFAALAAVIVVVINGLKSRQISTGYLSDDIGTSATITEEEDVESLSCAYGATSDELLELTNNDLVTDSSYIFVANFDADELIEVLYTNQQTFNLEESAEAGADIARTEYQSALQALNISADPFKTTYVANDEVLTIKHYAAVNKLTAQNLQLIDLDVDDIDDYTSVDALTIEQLEDAYSDQEYTCTVHNYAAEM